MTLLDAVRIETGPTTGAAPAAVIWLHGLGADGHDFEPIVPELGLPGTLSVRFVFPHAPSIPVTLNGGYVMPAWYDIREADLERRGDREGVDRSAAAIEALIAHEKRKGVPAERIVLAGFSQGAAMAMHVGLRHAERLAGMIALSGYLLFPERLAAEGSEANARTPLLLAHGTRDPMVPHAAGLGAARVLERLGHPVTWLEYPMAHQVCLEEIQAIGAFLRDVLREPS